ncbi:MAG: hypothetical protein ACUVWN_06885 [bacterium]
MYISKSVLSGKTLYFLVVFSMGIFVFSSSILAYSGGKVTSKKASSAIKIDGDLNDPAWLAVQSDFFGQEIIVNPQDWYQVKPKSGNNTNNGGLRVSRGQIDGDSDLKVFWMTTWDDDYLYFGFAVTDDLVTEYPGPYDVRTGDIDGFVLCFDTKHNAPVFEFPAKEFDTGAVAAQSTYQADDVFFIVAPITERKSPCVFEQTAAQQNLILNDPANGHVAAIKTNVGYNVEIRLPWSVFEPYYGGALIPKEGMAMGFDVTFMDSDPTYAAPLGGAMAWSSDFENDNSPSVLGELLLAPGGETLISPKGKLTNTWGNIKN